MKKDSDDTLLEKIHRRNKPRGTPEKNRKPIYNTIGVRFLDNLQVAKVYTYKIRGNVKVTLGQELIADTARGPALVAVVRIDKTPQDKDLAVQYQFIERKVVQL